MLTCQPRRGQQFILPSKRNVIVDRIYQTENIGCIYVNPNGSSLPGRRKTATFTPDFMFRYCVLVR